MFSVPNPDRPQRVALYARVSTEEQAERQTVDAQTDFLRRYAELYALPVSSLYVDDGVSGTLPLSKRPEGRRLLADAAAGAFNTVLVTRVDRLARSLHVLLDANADLDTRGVAIRSATEPFDTANAMGRFLFQLLGSLAELDRENTLEKLSRGRDRVARTGKRAAGSIPFGYDLDESKRMVPSERLIPGTSITEAAAVRDVFLNIAAGSTMGRECSRLEALGCRAVQRWINGRERPSKTPWSIPQLAYLLHNASYKGESILDSRYGAIVTDVPALVTVAMWDTVQRQLTSNRKLSKTGTSRLYPLRGLIRCARCNRTFVGQIVHVPRGNPPERPYYRCHGVDTAISRADRCHAKMVPAAWLEDTVWSTCREFILNPGAALAEAQAELRKRLEESATHEERRRDLVRLIGAKDQERENIMTLFRRGRANLDETERQLDALTAETAELRRLLEAVASQADLAHTYESQVAAAGAMLATLRDQVARIDAENDAAEKQRVINLLVHSIDVVTIDGQRPKGAEITVHYAFGEPTRTAIDRAQETGVVSNNVVMP